MDYPSPRDAKQSLVSVLTPVYNGGRYLAACIESVLSQTYHNWEYIIVNNCSTDNTLEIAMRYARQDSRIRIVNNQEFVGAVRNHNIALTEISPLSKYCKFVQADDEIYASCLTEMVRLAETHPSVGIVNSYQLVDRWVCSDGLPYPSTVLSGIEVCRKFFMQRERLWFGNMSAFLLRCDIVRRSPRFLNEQYLFADTEMYFTVLHEYDCGFVHQVLSFRRLPEDALSAFPERHNTWSIAILYLITKYGHMFLTPQEYKQCLKQSVDEYYRCQGRELFRLREGSFWRYHRDMLRELGLSFSVPHLLRGAVLEATDVLVEPVKAAGRQVRYVRRGQAKLRPGSTSKR